jgi:hypothetical protein
VRNHGYPDACGFDPWLERRLPPGVPYNEGQLDDDLWVLNPVDEGLNYFFNHSCDPNSTGEEARRDIAAGAELTMDHAIEMDGDHELSPCRCGTALCRRPRHRPGLARPDQRR